MIELMIIKTDKDFLQLADYLQINIHLCRELAFNWMPALHEYNRR